MNIEFEKKYCFTEHDYQIIKSATTLEEEKTIKDYYLDKDFILIKNDFVLRLRDGQYELKSRMKNKNTSKLAVSCEYSDDDEIEAELSKLWITTDDVTWVMFIETLRESYTSEFNWHSIQIDVESYQYGKKYEIEICQNPHEKKLSHKEANSLISDFRKSLWLTSMTDESCYKTEVCAMHQNIELYEIMTKNTIS